jgi:hypothetical protein
VLPDGNADLSYLTFWNQHTAAIQDRPPSVVATRTEAMSGWGLVSRASPVHTAVRNCPGDEGGPFGFGDQVADPKPPQAAVVKSDGGERCGKVGATIPAGKVERGERKRIVDEVSKAD